MSTGLLRYDEMCRAIDAAYKVDEVKDIRDKARAVEIYSRQAKNVEAERRACEIRLRAERKAGSLRRAEKKAKGGRPRKKGRPSGSEVLTNEARRKELGISEKQDRQWQGLAQVPEEQFEAALAGPEMPTTSGILASAQGEKPQVVRDERALWLWGRLQDFERDGLLDLDPKQLLEMMSDHMKETTIRLAPLVAGWLRRIEQ